METDDDPGPSSGVNRKGKRPPSSRISDSIPFEDVVKTMERITEEESGPKKKKVLERLVRKYREHFQKVYGTLDCDKAGGDSLYPLYRILLAKADRGRGAYGFQSPVLARMFVKVIGLDEDSNDAKLIKNFKVPSRYNQHVGDLSGVVYQVTKARLSSNEDDPNRKDPSLGEIQDILDKLARGRGHTEVKQDDQKKILKSLVPRLTPLEVKWLVRILLKDLHLGVSSNVIYGILHKDARSLSERILDLERLCKMLNDPSVDVSKMDIMLFEPFSPMLATRMDIIDSMFENNNSPCLMETEEPSTSTTAIKPKKFVSLPAPPFYVETKWDGERFQIHFDGTEFKYFSRRAHDFSEKFNETLTPQLQPLLARNVKSFIIDGEMMAYNKKHKMFTQKGYNVDVKTINKDNPNHSPVFVAFDILFLNGDILTKVPLKERRDKLTALFQPKENVIRISEVKLMNTKQEVIDCLDAAIDDGEEGLIVKSMNSHYLAGQRRYDWLKIKPEYLEDHSVSDLDLIILGAYYTESNFRGGQLNHFLLGVIDKDPKKKYPEYYPVAKVGTGRLRSIAVKELVQTLMSKFVKSSDSEGFSVAWKSVHCKQRKKPDFVIKPRDSVVVQVKASEIIPSDVYALGYTLRFPRIVKTREDKSPMDIMSVSEFHTMREVFRGKLAKRSDANDTQGRPFRRKRRYNSFSRSATGGGEDTAMDVDDNYDDSDSDQAPSPVKQPLTATQARDMIFKDDEDGDLDIKAPLFTKSSSKSDLSSSGGKSKSRTTSASTTPAQSPHKNKIFDKKEFCVYGRTAWKAEIEKKIRQYGGSISESPDVPGLFGIIGESRKHSPRVQNAIKSGKYDVLPGHSSSWVMRCIKEGKLLRLDFKDYWGMKKETKETLKYENDSYSDSYSMDTDIDEDVAVSQDVDGDGGSQSLAQEMSSPGRTTNNAAPSATASPFKSKTSSAASSTKVTPVKKKIGMMTFDDEDDDDCDSGRKPEKNEHRETPQSTESPEKIVAAAQEDDESTDFSDSESPFNTRDDDDKSQSQQEHEHANKDDSSDSDNTDFSESEEFGRGHPSENTTAATDASKTDNGEDAMVISEQISGDDEFVPPASFMSDVAAVFRGNISQKIKSKLKRCGGQELTNEDDESITHVIVCNEGSPSKESHSRAMVVKQKWLEDCLKKGEVVDELYYIV